MNVQSTVSGVVLGYIAVAVKKVSFVSRRWNCAVVLK